MSFDPRHHCGPFLWRPFALVLIALVACGCSSGDGLDRREVRGTVTMAGQPIEEGSITLFPIARGPVASGRIEDGSFTIERRHGPIPGEYRVEITGRKSTGKTIRVEEPGVEPREVREFKSIVPRQFNDRSELRITIETAESVAEEHFDLKAGPPLKG